MNEVTNWKVPKWPFFLGNALLFGFAYCFILRAPQAIHHWEIAAACVALGAAFNLLPYYLDYRAMERALEINALGAVGDKIQNLEKLAEQISSATNHWTTLEGSLQAEAGKTTAAAKAIAEQLIAESRQFAEVLQKIDDREKGLLRLEVEKLQRGEAEWLQLLMRLLDHVYALHTAAVRTGDQKYVEPVTNFQNACREIVHRVGLAPFVAEPDEPFNPEWYQVVGTNSPPPAKAVIAETVGTGYTFQGQLLRPAVVRLREAKPETAPPDGAARPSPVENENAELPL